MSDHQAGDGHRLRRASLKIAEQHRDLTRQELDLREAIAGGQRGRVERALVQLEGSVSAHFDLEEGAYYPASPQIDSEVAAQLQELIAEHTRLRAEAAQLFDCLKSDDLAAFDRAFSAFSRELAQHEDREEKLMEAILTPR